LQHVTVMIPLLMIGIQILIDVTEEKNGASRTGKIQVNRLNEDEIKRKREIALHSMPGYDVIPNDQHHRFQNEGQPQHTKGAGMVERISPKANQHHIPQFQGSTSVAPEPSKFAMQNYAHPDASLGSYDTLPDEFKAPPSPTSADAAHYTPINKLNKQDTTDNSVWMGKSLGKFQGVHQDLPEKLPIQRHPGEPAQGEADTTPIPDGSPTDLGFY
jgi:hypothetical protein